MKQEPTLLIQFLGNNPTLRIVDFFLDNRTDYSKKEIIEVLGMSKTTFYKVWPQFEKFRVVIPTRRYGKAQLYKLNEANPVVKKLMMLDFTLIRQAIPKYTERETTFVKKIKA